MNEELLNYACALKSALQAQMIPNVQLYKTGNMKSSVQIVIVDDNNIDIVIATNYASYTNERGYKKGWVDRVVNNLSRCYSENVENNLIDRYDEISEGDNENG